MAAAQVAMVDHLVGGRLQLGVGPGVPPDAEAIGDLDLEKGPRLPERQASRSRPDDGAPISDSTGVLSTPLLT
jgi:hypothetical protein